jgi:ketosteroid isomerase-like protein
MKIWMSIAIACLAATPASADVAAEALEHSKAFERAMNAQDLSAAVAHYADNARVVFPGQGEEANGKAEIERLLRSTLDALAGAKLTLQSQSAVPFAGGIGIVGRWRIELAGPEGAGETIELRRTEMLSKLGDRPVTIIDHLSVGVPPEEEIAAGSAEPPAASAAPAAPPAGPTPDGRERRSTGPRPEAR